MDLRSLSMRWKIGWRTPKVVWWGEVKMMVMTMRRSRIVFGFWWWCCDSGDDQILWNDLSDEGWQSTLDAERSEPVLRIFNRRCQWMRQRLFQTWLFNRKTIALEINPGAFTRGDDWFNKRANCDIKGVIQILKRLFEWKIAFSTIVCMCVWVWTTWQFDTAKESQ